MKIKRVLSMALLLVGVGCATERVVEFDERNPAVSYTKSGIYFDGELVTAAEVPEKLEELDIPKDRVIHVLLDSDVKDLTGPRILIAIIAKCGYRRTVLVTKRHAESLNLGKKKSQSQGFKRNAKEKPTIKYKRASE